MGQPVFLPSGGMARVAGAGAETGGGDGAGRHVAGRLPQPWAAQYEEQGVTGGGPGMPQPRQHHRHGASGAMGRLSRGLGVGAASVQALPSVAESTGSSVRS